MLDQIFRPDEPTRDPKVGELRLRNGKRSMCVCSCASYGGGSGPLWATEQEIALMTLVDFRYPGYIKVWCESVEPGNKTIDVLIVEGPTWGRFRQGSRQRISAIQIGRYNNEPIGGPDLTLECRDLELTIRAQQAFVDISRRELERDFIRAQSVELSRLIGESDAQRCYRVIKDYLELLHLVDKNGGWFLRHPNKRTRSLARRINATLAGEVQLEKNSSKTTIANAAVSAKGSVHE